MQPKIVGWAYRATHRRTAGSFLLLNLSFVLHERSTSQAVSDRASRCAGSRERMRRLVDPHDAATVTGDPMQKCDYLLTAHLGVHESLSRAITISGGQTLPSPFLLDADGGGLRQHMFFRAQAALSLPTEQTSRVMVAALVVRPGGTSTHLDIAGCFDWPSDTESAIAAVESLIRAYCDQWMPPRALWPSPAEILLREEVY